MTERIFITGNDAVGWGAINAGCTHFFGYPITPQNEIPAWFAKELPRRGGVFVQSESETGSINMVYGAAAAGTRVMTSTSSPGWSLMQEGMSFLATAESPAVAVLISRGGPGGGTMRHSQMDYLNVTRGGHGGYKNIALAPSSVQETHDLVQLAFYLADKYRNPVVVLSDGIMGQMREPVIVEKQDFGPLPGKDWAVKGLANHKDGRPREVHNANGMLYAAAYMPMLKNLDSKYRKIRDNEVRYELYRAEDAELLVVAFGYVSRVCREAVDIARMDGLKVGLLRLITLWPFPYDLIRQQVAKGVRHLVVEDNMGQMVDDVRCGVEGKTEVAFLGVFGRHLVTDLGIIFPDRVHKEIENTLRARQ